MKADEVTRDPSCPCQCRPESTPCGEPLRGIEVTWGDCILCHGGDHWQPGDDDPAFDWPAIFAAADEGSAT